MDWSNLPTHVLTKVLSHLTLLERFQISLVCKSWHQAFDSAQNWRRANFRFTGDSHQSSQILWISKYANLVTSLCLTVDQREKPNRLAALEFLSTLRQQSDRAMLKFAIAFVGENPLFYAGQEFVDALRDLFGEDAECRLLSVDLGKLPILLNDDMVLALANLHTTLRYLDIQNKQLVCKISPECLIRVIEKCPNLSDLRVFHRSLCDSALVDLAAPERTPLRHLSIQNHRMDKWESQELTEDAWTVLSRQWPELAVTLKFDHTCPIEVVRAVMKPVIPVHNLFLETFMSADDQLSIAVNLYAKSLRKVVVQSQPSEELDQALLQLSRRAHHLNAIHVMCILDQATIDTILEQHPEIKESGRYTLKNVLEPHPWVSDAILDEIQLRGGVLIHHV